MRNSERARLEAAVLDNFGKCVCLPKRICTCGAKAVCDCEMATCPGHRFLQEHIGHLDFVAYLGDRWLRGEGLQQAPPASPPEPEGRLPW
jgi:hypothetical protein